MSEYKEHSRNREHVILDSLQLPKFYNTEMSLRLISKSVKQVRQKPRTYLLVWEPQYLFPREPELGPHLGPHRTDGQALVGQPHLQQSVQHFFLTLEDFTLEDIAAKFVNSRDK